MEKANRTSPGSLDRIMKDVGKLKDALPISRAI